MAGAYLAAAGYEDELAEELRGAQLGVVRRHGRLFVTADPPIDAAWSANTWLDAVETPITSIGDAARHLRERQRNWALYAPVLRGRANLVVERLPHVSARPLRLGEPAPAAPLGSWTLLEHDRLLASAACSSPFSNGEPSLVEIRVGPPSRAYLKLWETFLRIRQWPVPGDTCLDLGASPGGWTWLLAHLGAHVTAVDKAELAPEVTALANVHWRQGSAFALHPDEVEPVDWLCCDVVSYPARLLGMVERWVSSGRAATMVCTVKFQGPTDHGIARAFASIPGGRLFHLHHNKHELTFVHAAARPA